jgi:hypothetical protein
MPRSGSPKVFQAVVFFATVWAVAASIFIIDNNLFSQPKKFYESDFIMTFYVAGQLVVAGRSDELYPNPGASSFVDSPFDRAAHEFLPELPKATTGAYMYTPLVAGFFAPLSLAGPNYSFLLWQAISMLALAFSSWSLSQISAQKWTDFYFLSFLFAPVFLTLWAGQLGLVFGLTPLCAGFLLLIRQRPLAAGMVWSLLLLKPQYFLAAAMPALILAISGRFRAFAGMAVGVVILAALTISLFSPALTMQWLQSHRVSDSIFSSGLHAIPGHLITGLPANLMILFPQHLREDLKWLLYTASAALWFFVIWFGVKIVRYGIADRVSNSIMVATGCMLCALTLPHLLYYDLCVLLPAGALLLSNKEPLFTGTTFKAIALTGWITISSFLPILLTYSKQLLLPLLLELLLLILFVIFLRQAKAVCRRAVTSHAAAAESHGTTGQPDCDR